MDKYYPFIEIIHRISFLLNYEKAYLTTSIKRAVYWANQIKQGRFQMYFLQYLKIICSMVVLALIQNTDPFLTHPAFSHVQPASVIELQVSLEAASGALIEFQTQNGFYKDGVPPQVHMLPHLVLRRNGAPAPPPERTLKVSIAGIPAEYPELYLTFTLETQHGDPDRGSREKERIKVWEKTILLQPEVLTTTVTELEILFHPHIYEAGQIVRTPTDYYRYEITLRTAKGADTPLLSFIREYAFLLENQWIVPLGSDTRLSQNKGLTEFAIYYADMFPYGTNYSFPKTRLYRSEVETFISSELLPAVLEAVHLQTVIWGFSWHEEWTSYRSGEQPGRLSIALFKEDVWFHGQSYHNANISLGPGLYVGDYAGLLDGLMATFHHELFHNLQKSIYQSMGGDGNVSGLDHAWAYFAEGTAELATSVGQADVQMKGEWGRRAYHWHVKNFLGKEGITDGNMKTSIGALHPYQAVLYWRYIYEQCGGISGEVEDPPKGMEVIRFTLETLYSGEIVDITSSTDLVGYLPQIMDRVFEETLTCPFRTYKESLLALSRAIFLLKVEGGRCPASGQANECGFFDPEGVYPNPPIRSASWSSIPVEETAGSLEITGSLPKGYTSELIEVVFEDKGEFSLLEVVLTHPTRVEFGLQIIPLPDGLGIIVTRLDANEGDASRGEYSLIIKSKLDVN
jgi:hypothetical protein